MRLFRRPSAPAPLSAELREALSKPVSEQEGAQTFFDVAKCSHCGGLHEHACPRVRRMRFKAAYGGSQLVEVEFWPDGEWSREGIIWPWDVHVEPALPRTPTPELSSPES